MKQNPTSDFPYCTPLIQRRCPTLKQSGNNVDATIPRRYFNVVSTLVKAISIRAGKTLRYKVLDKLYRNDELKVLVNFYLIVSDPNVQYISCFLQYQILKAEERINDDE